MECAFCNSEIQIETKISRQDTCPHCNRDLRCCKQCQFYDPGAYNECREVAAERIIDKERANFCDYFVPATDGTGADGEQKKAHDDTQEKLKKLFGAADQGLRQLEADDRGIEPVEIRPFVLGLVHLLILRNEQADELTTQFHGINPQFAQ